MTPQHSRKKNIRRVLYALPTLLVIVLTLALLMYIGYGEAQRTYPKFQMRKLATQGEIIRYSFQSFLQAGLPLQQYSGFAVLSSDLLSSDPSLQSVQIIDPTGTVVSANYQGSEEGGSENNLYNDEDYKTLNDFTDTPETKVEESESTYRFTMKLESPYGTAGYAIINMRKDAVFGAVKKKYDSVFLSFAILSAVFVVFLFFYELGLKNKKRRRRLVYIAAYVLSFVAMSTVISVTVFQLYGDGARANTRAVSDFMAKRLGNILSLGISFDDISGVNQTLYDYKKDNPNIEAISLSDGEKIIYHTDPDMIGKAYAANPGSYEYVRILNTSSGGPPREFRVLVSMPVGIVTQAILGSAKTFIVLFMSCILISIIFLDASSRLLVTGSKSKREDVGADGEISKNFEWKLSLIKPAYFLIVFFNALSVSFLPRVVTDMLSGNGAISATPSFPFTIYYLVFAIILIPAGQWAENGSLKRLMVAGFIAEACGLLTVALADNFWLLTVGRGLSGMGQGLFLIGLQSYLIAVTPEENRTQGAAVKVIARNSALIAGSAIGALLYSYMDYSHVFMVSSLLSLVGLVYLILLVPDIDPSEIRGGRPHRKRSAVRRLLFNILFALRDREFVKTWLFVGLIGKVAISGIVMFSIPLVMDILGFPTDDIGQALMLYYVASMVVTHYVSKTVDKLGKTWFVLFLSTLIGGLGMVILGFFGLNEGSSAMLPGFNLVRNLATMFNSTLLSTGIENFGRYIFVLCLVLAGVSNGLLVAPILTHISKTPVAERYGTKAMMATYVFLERLGHVLGPMTATLFFTLSDGSNLAISYFGFVTIILGIIFMVSTKKL